MVGTLVELRSRDPSRPTISSRERRIGETEESEDVKMLRSSRPITPAWIVAYL